ncbi:MAG: hypothetical protein E7G41_04905 [Bifidobacterium sp.]|nr:hypothetical protein [Bifidobacterium sp.]
MNTQLATIPAAMQNMMPALPEDQRALLASMFGGAMTSFGSLFNRLSIKGHRFHLMEGKQEVRTAADFLDIVILGIGAENYNVYYEGEYDPSKDDIKPTAMWGESEAVPACVPPTPAVGADGKPGKKPYSIRRRIVFSPIELDQQTGELKMDLSKLYVFDVNAMSMFGEPIPQSNAYSLGGYITFLRTAGLYPCVLGTRLVFDTRESVPVVKFIPYNNQGKPVMLPANYLTDVVSTIQSEPKVAELLDWRRQEEADAAAAQPAAGAQPDPAAAAQAQAQAEAEARAKAEAEARAKAEAEAKAKLEAEQSAALAGAANMTMAFSQPDTAAAAEPANVGTMNFAQPDAAAAPANTFQATDGAASGTVATGGVTQTQAAGAGGLADVMTGLLNDSDFDDA